MGRPPADAHSVKRLTKSALPVDIGPVMSVYVYMVRIYNDDFVIHGAAGVSICAYTCMWIMHTAIHMLFTYTDQILFIIFLYDVYVICN